MMPASETPPLEDPRRLTAVAELAESIARDRFAGCAVDPIGIINSCRGLTWSAGAYGDHFDGLLECDGHGFHIYLNNDRCARIDGGRGLFTLAHELGHYFIDEHHHWLKVHPHQSHCSFVLQEGAVTKPHEREADVFATNLLLPRATFRARVGCPAPSAEVVRDSADFFRTSLSTTAIRFTELEPFPCAAIKWGPGASRSWAKRSPRVAHHYGDVARTLDGVLADSLTARALRGDITITTPVHQPTIAEAWFPRIERAAHQANLSMERLCVPIDEHVLSLGRYGFLTFLCGHAWTGLRSSPDQNGRLAGK